MLHLSLWHNSRFSRSKHTHDNCWNDTEGYRSRESAVGVIWAPSNLNLTQADFHFSLAAVAELVPNKHRGHAQAALDLVTLPWSVFGSLLGNVMVKYSHLSFRINFIIGVILNVLSIASIWFFYHPVSSSPLPVVHWIVALALHSSYTEWSLCTRKLQICKLTHSSLPVSALKESPTSNE
jgi:hypothetical protein